MWYEAAEGISNESMGGNETNEESHSQITEDLIFQGSSSFNMSDSERLFKRVSKILLYKKLM